MAIRPPCGKYRASTHISGGWLRAVLVMLCVATCCGSANSSPMCTFPTVNIGGTCYNLCVPQYQAASPSTGTCTGVGVTCPANVLFLPSVPLKCCQWGQEPALVSTPQGLAYTGSCCPVGQAPQPNGSCLPQLIIICAAGQTPADNGCCLPGQAMTNRYTCCPVGQAPNADGSCGLNPCLGQPPNYGVDPANPTTCKAVCPEGQRAIPGSNACVCPNGYAPKDGSCRLNPCPPHQRLNAQDLCEIICPPGYTLDSATNSCSNPCPGMRVPDPYRKGLCVCPPGQSIIPGTNTCSSPPIRHQSESPAKCEDGLERRDAFRGDEVCVTRAVHDQTIADNAAAPSRTLPNGLCVKGYVWRRARAEDHVCVLPDTRAQTQLDNQRAAAQGQQVPSASPQQAVSSGTTAGSIQPICPPNSVLTTGITGPGPICLLKSITCPAGAAISVLSDGSGQACCPSGTTYLAAEKACWSQQQGKVTPLPFTCPPGWTLDNAVPNAPGASVCLQAPTCPALLLLRDGTCQPPIPLRAQPGREDLTVQPNAPIVCAAPSVLRDGRCITVRWPRRVPPRVFRPVVPQRLGRGSIGGTIGHTTTIHGPTRHAPVFHRH